MRKLTLGNAVLYHGDCRAVLANGLATVDIVVTSPPYNTLHTLRSNTEISQGEKWGRKAVAAYEDEMPEPEYQDWLRGVFDQCRAKTKGLIWVNHKLRWRGKGGIHPARILPYPIHTEIIWDRACGMPHNNRFSLSHEYVYGFGKPHYWNDLHKSKFTVWRIAPVSDKEACVFPTELIEPLIVSSCPYGGTVLDPFMGTGKTGVVALKHGRKFIGIEKNKRRFDEAVQRIKRVL